MKEIIFASHNQGKILEIRQLLSPFGVKVLSSDDIELPDVEETGTTFEENAALKALSIAKLKNMPCLADDSGLCVDVLDGRPGVYSARYAPNRDFKKAMEMLLAIISTDFICRYSFWFQDISQILKKIKTFGSL